VVLVTSTFKVANGMEAAVRQAFLDRPGLVEDAPGFLGMDVVVDNQDGCIFQLLTRWTSQEFFQSWHSSAAHKLSHRWIPKGLKLDASHTSIRTFDILPDPIPKAPASNDNAPIARLPRFLARTWTLHWLRARLDGGIVAANPAFESLLQEAAGGLAGQCLWDRLTEADAASIQAILKSGDPDPDLALLNFVDCDNTVHTLGCHVEVNREDFVLVGEPAREYDRALAKELLEMNNRWVLLVRENEKSAKALQQANEKLEQTLAELNKSHWHLRKIQETLPICMYCGKVKTGEAQWEGVVEYLKTNSLFLSHGCCPNCLNLMTGGESGEQANAER
jgi:heme-degrading monooxygenase HmoA